MEAGVEDFLDNYPPHFRQMLESITVLVETAIPLTISTRGIGFATAILYERTCNALSIMKVSNIISIHQVYRIHLWLAKLKLYFAQQIQTETVNTNNVLLHQTMNSETVSHLVTITRLPGIFGRILNCIGKFEADKGVFHAGFFNITSPNNCEVSLCIHPDNIRRLLVHLSNDDPAFANDRLDFVQHNSIPGARFDADNVLLNADEIWPENAENLVAHDVQCYRRWIEFLGTTSRLPRHFLGTMPEWNGHATSGVTWSTDRQPLRLTSYFSPGGSQRDEIVRDAYGHLIQSPRNFPALMYSSFSLTSRRCKFWSPVWNRTNSEDVFGTTSLVGEVCGLLTRSIEGGHYVTHANPVRNLRIFVDDLGIN